MNSCEHLMDRRGLLKVGMLGSLGLCLTDLLRLQAHGETTRTATPQTTSVIILFMRGGPSQLGHLGHEARGAGGDPRRIRSNCNPRPWHSDLRTLAANRPHHGQWSIVRSLQHPAQYGDVSHSRGDQVVFTGYAPGPGR